VKTRRIGPFEVSCIGLGCMSFSHAYGTPPPPEQAERVMLAALERGVTLFDTAALYGFGANETLVGRVLQPHRSRIVLASKGGIGGVTTPEGTRRVIDGRPETLRRQCDESLQRLRTDVIDLYYLHRWDKKVPIEESMGALADLVRAGKVRALGLSEVSAQTLRKAHAVHPIAAVQSEYSLWSRVVEIGVLDACRAVGAAFVAFSPVGRGYLSGRLRDVQQLDPKDIRRQMPRFSPDNYATNMRLLDPVVAMAHDVGCTPAQLALAWLLHQGDDVVPIPGTTQHEHLIDNLGAAAVALTAQQVSRLGVSLHDRTVAGARYSLATQSEVDTEQFA
jgi:aryl-alcohol dehydrogenase-like predicted oxidoreductase